MTDAGVTALGAGPMLFKVTDAVVISLGAGCGQGDFEAEVFLLPFLARLHAITKNCIHVLLHCR